VKAKKVEQVLQQLVAALKHEAVLHDLGSDKKHTASIILNGDGEMALVVKNESGETVENLREIREIYELADFICETKP